MTIASARKQLDDAANVAEELHKEVHPNLTRKTYKLIAHLYDALRELDDTHTPSVTHDQMTRLLNTLEHYKALRTIPKDNMAGPAGYLAGTASSER